MNIFQDRQDNMIKEEINSPYDSYFTPQRWRGSSVLRNKTTLRFQFLMTKYEPRSRSKIIVAVKKISFVLLVSNSGLCLGLWGKKLVVTKPCETIKANEMFQRMSGM